MAHRQLTEPQPLTRRADRALGLRRGDAFADIPCGPSLEAERARLEERRLVAAELRVEAELAAGYVPDAICELRSLTSRYPLRERLRAHLMRALWSTGRRAEALAVYRDVRRIFAEELGLEPSEDLRSLEQTIITGDYTTSQPPRSAPSPPATGGGLSASGYRPAGARPGPAGAAGGW